MKSTPKPPKPPVGLVIARKKAIALDEVASAYVRRRLESLRFNLDGAALWVDVSIIQAREKDKPWLLTVASQLAATSKHVSELTRLRAFNGPDWTQQAKSILVAIDGMLSLYADAAEDGHWGYR